MTNMPDTKPRWLENVALRLAGGNSVGSTLAAEEEPIFRFIDIGVSGYEFRFVSLLQDSKSNVTQKVVGQLLPRGRPR
jgi:hypothetical protein